MRDKTKINTLCHTGTLLISYANILKFKINFWSDLCDAEVGELWVQSLKVLLTAHISYPGVKEHLWGGQWQSVRLVCWKEGSPDNCWKVLAPPPLHVFVYIDLIEKTDSPCINKYSCSNNTFLFRFWLNINEIKW